MNDVMTPAKLFVPVSSYNQLYDCLCSVFFVFVNAPFWLTRPSRDNGQTCPSSSHVLLLRATEGKPIANDISKNV